MVFENGDGDWKLFIMFLLDFCTYVSMLFVSADMLLGRVHDLHVEKGLESLVKCVWP